MLGSHGVPGYCRDRRGAKAHVQRYCFSNKIGTIHRIDSYHLRSHRLLCFSEQILSKHLLVL